jgi:hypothetical protein
MAIGDFVRESKIGTVFYHGSVYEIWSFDLPKDFDDIRMLDAITRNIEEGRTQILNNTFRVVCIGPKSKD